MINLIAVHGDRDPVTSHAGRAPWSVLQDGSTPSACTRGVRREARPQITGQPEGGGPGGRAFRPASPIPTAFAPSSLLLHPVHPGRVPRALPRKADLPQYLLPIRSGGPAPAAPGTTHVTRLRPGPRPGTSPARCTPDFLVSKAYSWTATELGARIHRAGLDGLLALLPECFAQFPQGTYVLSGYQVEI